MKTEPALNCRLFVTDLDGTILFDRGTEGAFSTSETRQALQALQASGVTVCLASGRMHESMVLIAQEMGLKGPIVSYNGAMIRDESGELIHHSPLAADIADQVLQMALKRNIALNYYLDGKIYARRFQPWWDLYQGRTASPMVAVDDLGVYAGSSPTKLLMISDPQNIKNLHAELAPRFEGRANVIITNDEYLEFMAHDVNKGAALRQLAQYLNIPLSDTIAAGDGYNDLEMIEAAGYGVAVSSGREAVRHAADTVVASPQDSGLAHFIFKQLIGNHG